MIEFILAGICMVLIAILYMLKNMVDLINLNSSITESYKRTEILYLKALLKYAEDDEDYETCRKIQELLNRAENDNRF